MNDVELKPCPFCGGKAYITNFDVFGGVKYVVCADCGARIQAPEKAKVAIAWNARAEQKTDCPYCAGYEAELMLPIIEMDENTANSLDVDGGFAYIHCYCGRHTVGKINYCPMCGHKLCD